MGQQLFRKIALHRNHVEAATIYALLFPELVNRKKRGERKDQ